MKKALRMIGRVLAGALALLLCLLLVLVAVPMTETGDKTEIPGSADWMADLSDDKRLCELVLPGTHDSGTQFVQLAFFSKCQARSIGQQLEAGFRYLDIRLGEDESGELQLMHGFTRCKTGALTKSSLKLDDVLAECCDFLDAHPTETVVFAVKQEHGALSVAAFESLLDAAVRENESYWLLTDSMPTLGEARGKLVLLRRYEGTGLSLLWENQNGHDDTSRNTAQEDNGSYTLWVQDRYEYGVGDKWDAFLTGLDTAQTDSENAAVHFLSTKGTLPQGHPWFFAQKLNPQLMALDKGQLSGWIVVDFLTPELAQAIYAANP